MSEILAQRKTEIGELWTIRKETTENIVAITVERKWFEKPVETKCTIKYRNIDEEYQSPFLNWENLIFCSNNYGPAPFYDYMNHAVQMGKKTAATVYEEFNSNSAKELINSLPQDCDWKKFDNSSNILFIFHKGCLANFFSLSDIQEIYCKHEICDINWHFIEEQFNKPLPFFASPETCGFNLQNG